MVNAYEIFVSDVYRCPRPEMLGAVRRIVDLGANIGLSCLTWAKRFPNAHITAFEPHPLHCEIAEKQLEINGLRDRITIVNAAAGTSDGTAKLSSEGVNSSLLHSSEDGVEVAVVDVFHRLAGQPVGLLNIGIEGYEYEILADRRFADLCPKAIVMEWHNTTAVPNGGAWSTQRLESLGYTVIQGNDQHDSTGVLWGFRTGNQGELGRIVRC